MLWQSSKRARARWLWAGCLLWASWLTPNAAHAQQNASGKAAAEALFDEGLKLLRDNKLDAACARFEKSQGIDPAVGTLLYLAECYERTGRIASAWATFREAASSASAAGQSDRAAVGTERANKLEPKLSRLTVDVGGNAAIVGFSVDRDGQAVPAAVYGEPLPVDPGEHKLVATAPGYEPWRVQLSIPTTGGSQSLSIPPLNPLPAPLPEVAPLVPAPPPPVSSQQDTPPPQSHEADLTWAWISGGVGVVGVGVGVFFGLDAASLDQDAKEHCEGVACFDQEGERLSEDARDAALIANIGYGVGAVGLGTAVVLAIIALQDDEPPLASSRSSLASSRSSLASSRSSAAASGDAAWSVLPTFGQQGASLLMQGQF